MSQEILEKHWQEHITKPSVLNIVFSNKFTAGRDTGTRAIVFWVNRKRPAAEISAEELIPREIEGVPTDVVELRPKGWIAGKTALSMMHPEVRRRLLGLQEKPREHPQKPRGAKPETPNGQSDLHKLAQPVQDQGNCGDCTGEGSTATAEGCLASLDPPITVKLSASDAFRCSGGTCANGNTVPAALNYFVNVGVCSEECCPTTDVDQACGYGRCANPVLYKASSWYAISDPTEIKVALDTHPLNATMTVYESFFNYVSGVYAHVAGDAIAGYHDISAYGYSDTMGAHLIKNSWGTGWGSGCIALDGTAIPGYAWLKYGELDAEMQEMVMIAPSPNPPPPAPKFTLGLAVIGQGAIAANPQQPTYDSGTSVKLAATPASGWQFSRWSGDLNGSNNPAVLVMDGNKSVTATFVQPSPPPAPVKKCNIWGWLTGNADDNYGACVDIRFSIPNWTISKVFLAAFITVLMNTGGYVVTHDLWPRYQWLTLFIISSLGFVLTAIGGTVNSTRLRRITARIRKIEQDIIKVVGR